VEREKRLVIISIFSKYRVWNFPEEYVQMLREEFPEFAFIQTREKSDYLDNIGAAEIVVSFRFTPEDFHLSRSMKWLHIAGAGVGKIIFDDLIKSEVIITKTSGINKEAVSEMAWGFILCLSKMFPVWIENKMKGDILSDTIDFTGISRER